MTERHQPLFRDEALNEQRNRWLGAVVFDQRLSPLLILLFCLLVIGVSLTIVGTSDYTRKARLDGWLVPNTGLVKIQAPFAGRVTDILVAEGQYVSAGMDLLVISSEQTAQDGQKIGTAVYDSLRKREQSLASDRALRVELNQQQRRSLGTRLNSLRQQKSAVDAELDIAQRQITLNDEFMVNQRNLFTQSLITQEQYLAYQEQNLERAAQAERLKQSAANLLVQINDSQAQLRELPLSLQVELAQIDRTLEEIQQQLAETALQRGVIVQAPVSGTVSSLQVSNSANVPVNVPIVTIVPEGSTLEAHLYGSSRTVGFVRAGQQVSLRYEAFPFQRYGVFKGRVIAVSGSATSPAELPTELSLFAAQQTRTDPLYRVVVSLEQQAITSGSRLVPLQTGMQLQADIALEERSVLRWLLDPILRLGRNA